MFLYLLMSVIVYVGDDAVGFMFMVEMLCTCAVSIMPVVDNVVVGSTRRLFFRSMSKPCVAMKSAPIIGVETSAMVKTHRSGRRKRRSSVNSCWPYVFIMVEFAAWRIKGEVVSLPDVNDFGYMDIVEPESMRNL